MNIFILGTGRCGTKAFIKACKHISNFTSAHESSNGQIGVHKFNFPDNHIEADNRLIWFFGTLEKAYSNKKVLYVHMRRNKSKVANSFNRRWYGMHSIIRSFSWGISYINWLRSSKEKRYSCCEFYVETVTDNIDSFLSNKKNTIVVNLENIEADFEKFWKYVEAEGDLNLALNSFTHESNKSKWYQKSI